MALLPAETLDFGYRNALDADAVEGILDLVELERFDNRLDFFHGISSWQSI
jgi:hypothetical protein